MIKKPMLAIGLAAALTFAATAVQAQTNTPTNAMSPAPAKTASKADQKFMTDAIQANLAEIQVGKLAQEKGGPEDVKKFGNTLVTDHSANLAQAQQVAQGLGITAPTEPNASQKAEYEGLSKLSGAAFDRQFARDMVHDHVAAIREFREAAKKSDAPGQYAKASLPGLHMHLRIAQGLTASKMSSR
jgi:putative membrane protein